MDKEKTNEEIEKEIWDKGIKEKDLELLNEMVWSKGFSKKVGKETFSEFPKENEEITTRNTVYNRLLDDKTKRFVFGWIGELQEHHRKLQQEIIKWKVEDKTREELKKYFEEKYLKGTCFDSFEDLMNDKTLVQVNAPRALIAVELMGVWRGLNDQRKD